MSPKIPLICIALILATSFSHAQRLRTPTLSPITKITQQVGLTEIGLEYSRPSAKGREVMGGLVPYGDIWRTRANASTKITLTESATIGGNPVEAGTFALYTIPREDAWTIIIHGNTKMRSLAGDVYKPANDIFRFEAPALHSPDFVETFTLQFADLQTDSVNLELSWANTVVKIPFGVEVNEKIAAKMTELLKAPDKVPHRTYFQAAEYNLHNDGDLDNALTWINTALDMKRPRTRVTGCSRQRYKPSKATVMKRWIQSTKPTNGRSTPTTPTTPARRTFSAPR